LAKAGARVEALTEGRDDVERAEGYRFLTRVLSAMIDFSIEADGERPAFVRVMTPTRKFFGDCPDTMYHRATLRPGAGYRITGQRGGCIYLAFCVYGLRGKRNAILANVSDAELDFAEDGSFEIILSAERPEGTANWLQLEPAAATLVARQYFADWETETPARFNIEALEPVGPPSAPQPDEVARRLRALGESMTRTDPRIAQVEEWAAGFAKVAPRLAAAHKLEPRGPEECLWLIEHTFTDLIFELRAHVPTYSEWLAEHEADVGVYWYFHRQLQMLGTHCRGRHWVFKAPRHWAGLSGLLAVFPEARIVQTHREPAAVLPSLCSLCEILQGAASDESDRAAIDARWRQRLMNIFQRGREARANAKAEQFLDVQFAELMADPIGAVRRIYEYHGYEYSVEFEANMKQWLAENRRHQHGTHRYTLEDFGLEAAQVKADFVDYCGEFGLD